MSTPGETDVERTLKIDASPQVIRRRLAAWALQQRYRCTHDTSQRWAFRRRVPWWAALGSWLWVPAYRTLPAEVEVQVTQATCTVVRCLVRCQGWDTFCAEMEMELLFDYLNGQYGD